MDIENGKLVFRTRGANRLVTLYVCLANLRALHILQLQWSSHFHYCALTQCDSISCGHFDAIHLGRTLAQKSDVNVDDGSEASLVLANAEKN